VGDSEEEGGVRCASRKGITLKLEGDARGRSQLERPSWGVIKREQPTTEYL
jgi:hypothetical protein